MSPWPDRGYVLDLREPVCWWYVWGRLERMYFDDED